MTDRESLEGEWEVSGLAVGGELQPPIGGSRLTLTVDDDRVWGRSGVNRFTGGFGEDGVFGPLAVTRMAGPQDLMIQEDIYLRHLSDAEGWEEQQGGISLLAGGLIVLTLVPISNLSGGPSAERA